MGKVTRVLIYNRGVLERGAALVSSVQCPVLVSSAAATHRTCDTAGWLPVSACQDQNPTSSFLDRVVEKGSQGNLL